MQYDSAGSLLEVLGVILLLTTVKFSFFKHKHKFKLVASTYTPPIKTHDVPSVYDMNHAKDSLERAIHGCTTFVWKCADPTCGKVISETVLGRDSGLVTVSEVMDS